MWSTPIWEPISYRQTIADGVPDYISADAFHLFCSQRGLFTRMRPEPPKRDWSILLRLQTDYKWKPERCRSQNSVPLPTDSIHMQISSL